MVLLEFQITRKLGQNAANRVFPPRFESGNAYTGSMLNQMDTDNEMTKRTSHMVWTP